MKENEMLMQKAKDVSENAYAPYSGFKVGAALMCADGSIYTGCNVENASYPAGICAESSALASAVSDGKREFVKIAVYASETAYPCGICRQRLGEFSDMDVIVMRNGKIVQNKLSELLPEAFSLNANDIQNKK